MAHGCLKTLFYVMFMLLHFMKNYLFLETLPFYCDDFIIVLRGRERERQKKILKKKKKLLKIIFLCVDGHFLVQINMSRAVLNPLSFWLESTKFVSLFEY